MCDKDNDKKVFTFFFSFNIILVLSVIKCRC